MRRIIGIINNAHAIPFCRSIQWIFSCCQHVIHFNQIKLFFLIQLNISWSSVLSFYYGDDEMSNTNAETFVSFSGRLKNLVNHLSKEAALHFVICVFVFVYVFVFVFVFVFAMWDIFLFPFKIWLTTCQRSNLQISTGEGWEEVSLSKLKQAERVTSPLCPERCIIGWDGLIDAILTTSPPLSLHSPSRDVWKDFLLFLPHLPSCCAYHHHSTPISWPVDLENMLERRYCQRMCCCSGGQL